MLLEVGVAQGEVGRYGVLPVLVILARRVVVDGCALVVHAWINHISSYGI
jgi:hypothetical protein